MAAPSGVKGNVALDWINDQEFDKEARLAKDVL